MAKNLFSRLLIWVVAASLTAACGPLQQPAAPTPPETDALVTVSVLPAYIGDIEVELAFLANVEPDHQVDLVPLRTGRLELLKVDVGDAVQKGQIIAELGHGQLDAQLHRAQAQLANAEAKLGELQGSSAISRARAQAKLDSALADLEQLTSPTAEDIEVLESAVEEAQAQVSNAELKLQQALNPTEAALSDPIAGVGEAESKLSKARQDVNEEIKKYLAKTTGVTENTSWSWILNARLSQEASRASMQNLKENFGVDADSFEIQREEENIANKQRVISNLLSEIEENSLIPQEINSALWAETSAALTLDQAKKELADLQRPDERTIGLLRNELHSSETKLDAARTRLHQLQHPSPALVAAAQAKVAEAEQDLALFHPNQVAYQISAAEATVLHYRSEVESVEQELSETKILAPFDGLVTHRWLSPGAQVSPEKPVVTVIGREREISVEVGESWINSVQIGQKAFFMPSGLLGTRFELKVYQISPGSSESTHNFEVHLRPEKPAPELKPGMSGEVKLALKRENVLLAPKSAVLNLNHQPAVYVVRENKAHLRPIEMGIVSEESVEIRGGIEAGDPVVVLGKESLQDGAPVFIK